MTARKPTAADSPARQAAEAESLVLRPVSREEIQTRTGHDGFNASIVLGAVGMGLAMQSATHAGEISLQSSGTQPGAGPAPATDAVVSVIPAMMTAGPSELGIAGDSDLLLTSFSAAPVEPATTETTIEISFGDLPGSAAVLAFAPQLGADPANGAGEGPVRIATNTTLPQHSNVMEPPATSVPPVDTGPPSSTPPAALPAAPQDTAENGENDPITTILDPILGEDGLVGSVLDPLLGEDGLVGSVLDPLLGEDGLVGSVLDPVLGEDGLVGSVLDPLLGEDGVIGSVLDPVLGEDGLVGSVLDPLLGEGGLVGSVLDPVLGENGLVSSVLDPLLGENGLVSSVLDPLLGEDGLVGSVLDPLLGEDGLVGSVLDPVLGAEGILGSSLNPVTGDDGLLTSVLDPLLGDEGILDNVAGTVGDGLITPVLGQDGILGSVLDPLLGQESVLDHSLDPVLGEDGLVGSVIDPLLGEDGLVSGALDPVLGEDGLLGDVLAPITGADGVLDSVLSPVLGGLGPVGGVVDSVLGGLFGGWGQRDEPVADTPPQTSSVEADETEEAALAEPATADPVLGDAAAAVPQGGAGDDGFVESLLGAPTLLAGAETLDEMQALLSAPVDGLLDDLLTDDLLAGIDAPGDEGLLNAVAGDDLLDELLGLGLSGSLVQEILPDAPPETEASDPELDALLSEILDSGERMLGGVTDPLASLLDFGPEGDGGESGLFAPDLAPVVEGALDTLFGPATAEDAGQGGGGLLGGLLGGLGQAPQDDDPT